MNHLLFEMFPSKKVDPDPRGVGSVTVTKSDDGSSVSIKVFFVYNEHTIIRKEVVTGSSEFIEDFMESFSISMAKKLYYKSLRRHKLWMRNTRKAQKAQPEKQI